MRSSSCQGHGLALDGLLSMRGDKQWLSVGPQVAQTGPQAPGGPASHSGQGENGLCPGRSSDHFPVARTPENVGQWVSFREPRVGRVAAQLVAEECLTGLWAVFYKYAVRAKSLGRLSS